MGVTNIYENPQTEEKKREEKGFSGMTADEFLVKKQAVAVTLVLFAHYAVNPVYVLAGRVNQNVLPLPGSL